MTKREMKKYQKLLLDEQGHLSQGIRKIEQNTLENTERESGGDLTSFAETGTDNNERDTALRVASGESDWLHEISDALDRINKATYGNCESCESDIPVKRLEVFPSARYCITCQSKLEKDGVL